MKNGQFGVFGYAQVEFISKGGIYAHVEFISKRIIYAHVEFISKGGIFKRFQK